LFKLFFSYAISNISYYLTLHYSVQFTFIQVKTSSYFTVRAVEKLTSRIGLGLGHSALVVLGCPSKVLDELTLIEHGACVPKYVFHDQFGIL
jgi:hypothetical protein